MVICVRMEHLGVLCVCAFQIGEPGEKPLRASREPTTHSTKKKKKQTQLTYDVDTRFQT